MKTLLVIEPARIIRKEIKKILAQKEGRGIRLIGEMSSGMEGLTRAIAERPDVVLMEIDLPDISGLVIQKRLKDLLPQTQAIFFTGPRSVIFPLRAFELKAAGYLTKEESLSVVVQAILTASGEQPIFSTSIMKMMAQAKFDSDHVCHRLATLSINEMLLLRELAQGKNPQQVSKELNLARQTILLYRRSLLKKLQLPNELALAYFAKKHRLIDCIATFREVENG
ncbi:MAG: response regulator transcription factor [Gammaproteobacteria bacterium]|nr:response regulator transcription factor [Gammaproteobacteria bacterium]